MPFFACISDVHHIYAMLVKDRRGCWAPGNGGAAGCELPYRNSELKPSVLMAESAFNHFISPAPKTVVLF